MAEAQHGVFNLGQALRAGHDHHSIRDRIRRGRWIRVLPTVFAFAGSPILKEGRLMASAIWDAGRAFVSGPAAAGLHGMNGFQSAKLEVSTVSDRVAPATGLRVRRVHRYALNEVQLVRGIPVSSPRWTVLDLAGQQHPRTERAFDQFLREEKASLYDFWDLMDRRITVGRRGIRLYRHLIIHRTPGQAPTDSDLEDMYWDLVRDFDLPIPKNQWEVQLPVMGRVFFDFGYPDVDRAVEVDGYAWHGDRLAFDRDRMKDAEARLVGIEVLRLTWTMLKWNREYTARLVRHHLGNTRGSK